MKTITVVTPSNIEVEYRLAGAGSRLAAFLIDYFIQILLWIISGVFILWFLDRVIFGNTDTPSGQAIGAFMVFVFIVHFGYFVLSEMTMGGQSIGKRVFGLRVIRDNGQPLEFWQSLVRGLLRASVDMLYIGLFIILFSKKHKRLGDMAAGTIVISEHYEDEEPALFAQVPEWQSFLPDPFILTSEERQLTEEWLSRRHDLPDGGAAIGNKLVEYFKKYDIKPEGEILHEGFSD